MPNVGTAYTIGVIREKEKGFLTDTEYTRIIEAPTKEEALHVLIDTPYGKWLNSENNPFKAISRHLQQELMWLIDQMENPALVRFITARYNALDILTALHELNSGRDYLSDVSPLSGITKEALHAALWHNTSWDQLPDEWIGWLKEEKGLMQKRDWNTTESAMRIAKHTLLIMEENAATPLLKEIISLKKQRSEFDKSVRQIAGKAPDKPMDIKRTLLNFRYLDNEAVEKLIRHESAMDYEKGWDEEMMAILRRYRLLTMGSDPIISYWYGKETEGRHLRLIMAAKIGGVPIEVLHNLKRTQYTKFA